MSPYLYLCWINCPGLFKQEGTVQCVAPESVFQPVDHSRDTFERLVEKFPTSGRYWKMYIDHEVRISIATKLVQNSYKIEK